MRRRTVLKSLAGALAIPVAAACGKSSSPGGGSSADTSKKYSVTFDKNSYTTKSKTVSTGSGRRTVKYRFYRNNVYVQHPVNYKYQSLNVSVPAFDAFDLSATENTVYGDATSNARHFTLYSLRHATGNSRAQLASDLPATIAMMNPLYHLRRKNPSRARHWWIRTGTLDTNTAHTVVASLAAITGELGDSVNSAMYWDGGHAVNFDSPDLIAWIGELTGYTVA